MQFVAKIEEQNFQKPNCAILILDSKSFFLIRSLAPHTKNVDKASTWKRMATEKLYFVSLPNKNHFDFPDIHFTWVASEAITLLYFTLQ